MAAWFARGGDSGGYADCSQPKVEPGQAQMCGRDVVLCYRAFAGDIIMAVAALGLLYSRRKGKGPKQLRAFSGLFIAGFSVDMAAFLFRLAACVSFPFTAIAYFILVNKYLVAGAPVKNRSGRP